MNTPRQLPPVTRAIKILTPRHDGSPMTSTVNHGRSEDEPAETRSTLADLLAPHALRPATSWQIKQPSPTSTMPFPDLRS